MHAGWIIQVISINPKAAKECASRCLGYDKDHKSKFAETFQNIVAKSSKDTCSFEAILLILDSLVNVDNRDIVLERFKKLDNLFIEISSDFNKPRPILAWHVFSTMVEAYNVTEDKLAMMDRMQALAAKVHTKESYLTTRLEMQLCPLYVKMNY